MRLVVLTAVLLSLTLSAPARAEEGAILLRALADEEAEGHAAARAQWEALSEAERVALLREALHGEVEDVARIAARALGPEHLSAAEIRRQMDLRSKDDPLDWERAGGSLYEWAPGSELSFGGPDVVRLFQAAVADPECRPDLEAFQQVHRAANPDHLPGLVALLDLGTPEVFANLLWTIDLLATYDAADRHRPLVARAFLYARARLDAEATGDPPPRLADVGAVEVEPTEGGLPDAFVRLIEEEMLHRRGWPRRWARDLTPGAKDVALLERLVRTRDSYLPFWALRHLARIGTADVLAFVREVAAETKYPAVRAAAALHEVGISDPWEALWRESETRGAAAAVAWEVDPERARRHFLEEGEPRDLEIGQRHEDAVYHGIHVRDEDVRWIAERIEASGRPIVDVVRFFTDAYPEGLTTDRATRLARRLHDLSDEELSSLDRERTLGLLEVAAPQALVALLRAWSARDPEAEIYLWRFGEVGREALVEHWLDGAEEELAQEALIALTVLDGLPVQVAVHEFLYLYDPLDDEEPMASIRRLILAGKPIDAVLRLEGVGEEEWISPVWGLLQDPRISAMTERARSERHRGLYWQGTAARAIAGDDEARRDFLSLLGDDRTWMFDAWGDRSLALFGDLDLAPVWIEKIDHNCCLAFHAHTALKEGLFPTLPFRHNFPVPLREAVETWYRRGLARGFVWSRILRGWVPRPTPE